MYMLTQTFSVHICSETYFRLIWPNYDFSMISLLWNLRTELMNVIWMWDYSYFFEEIRLCKTVPAYQWNQFYIYIILLEPGQSISYRTACAPSETSDQHVHPHSLIRIFAWDTVGSRGSRACSGGQQNLISLAGFPGWSEPSLNAHANM